MNKVSKLMLVAVALLTSGAIIAGCSRWHHGGRPEERVDKAASRIAWTLDFDKDQKAKLDIIKNDVIAKLKEGKPFRESMHKETVELVKRDNLDREAVIAVLDKMIDHFNKNKTFIADKIVAFHAILTPEQKKKIVEHMEDRYKDTQ